MVSKTRTVDVPVEQYADVVPDWYWSDTVPIEVTAFSDKLYIDFPDWSRVEREVDRLLDNDDLVHSTGDEPAYPLDRSRITSREQALMWVVPRYCNDDGLVIDATGDTKTSQFCTGITNVMRAYVSYEPDKRLGPDFAPIKRYYRDGQERNRHYNGSSDDPLDWDLDHTHKRLLTAFRNVVGDEITSAYYQGYHDGSGDDWNDIAHRIFRDEFEGHQDLCLDVGTWFAETGEVVSQRSNRCFPIPDWGRTSGSYVATVASFEAGQCSQCGASLSETRTCTRSSNRTRVANRYQCDPEKGGCGHSFTGITTG